MYASPISKSNLGSCASFGVLLFMVSPPFLEGDGYKTRNAKIETFQTLSGAPSEDDVTESAI